MNNIIKLVAPATEEEIVKNWKYLDRIYISCVCITFNQEEYIRDAIESMLAQKSEFKFEIIIHDDVSTDGTKNILLEYKEKYPSIIKLVLQEQNQYLLGKKIMPLAIEHASGDFIALCEGDDFWIDSFKIHKQIESLRTNKDINLVISKSIALDPNGLCNYFCDLGESIKHVDFSDCILGPERDFFPTATFFFKKSIMKSLPDWFYTIAPVGDYYLQLFASYNKGCIYLPESTSVYRRNAAGSWSSSLSYEKEIKDKQARLNCNSLLRNNLKLNKRQLLALNKRESIYRKNLSSLYFRSNKYNHFIASTLKGFLRNPFIYTRLNCIAIVRLLKRVVKK